jgi:hypothetical protein
VTALRPGGNGGGAGEDRAAYAALCERSEVAIGCPVKPRRIFKLYCRLDGRDCEVEVGKPLPSGEGVVLAILDHGREEAFAVYTDSRERDVVRVSRHVYAVTEFA